LAREGTSGQKPVAILEDLNPESAYFTERGGTRCAILVVDIGDVSEIPRYAKPLFLTFNANCQFPIAMSPKDLARSSPDGLGQKWG